MKQNYFLIALLFLLIPSINYSQKILTFDFNGLEENELKANFNYRNLAASIVPKET